MIVDVRVDCISVTCPYRALEVPQRHATMSRTDALEESLNDVFHVEYSNGGFLACTQGCEHL